MTEFPVGTKQWQGNDPSENRLGSTEDAEVLRTGPRCERCGCDHQSKMRDGWHCQYCGWLVED
jgi:hypothetical protein